MFEFCADHDKIGSAFNTECVGCQMQGTPYGLQTLRGLRERPEAVDGVHPMIAQAQADAVSSQLADLEAELREYESVRAGEFRMDRLRVAGGCRPTSPAHQGTHLPGSQSKGVGGLAGTEGTADTAVRGHGLRHRQMVPHQRDGECIRHRPEQPRPARGIPLNRDARYAALPMGLRRNDLPDGDGVVLW